MEGKNFKVYKDKGYIFNWRDIIDIKVEDLLDKSNVMVKVVSDNENFFDTSFEEQPKGDVKDVKGYGKK